MPRNDSPSHSALTRLIRLIHHFSRTASKAGQACCFIAMCLCLQIAHAQESNPKESSAQVKPQIKAELVGLSKDGNEVTARITNQTGRRVKKLAGFVNFINDKGGHLPDAPMVHFTFRSYLFDEEPTFLRSWAVPEKAVAFRTMMRDNPAGVHVEFDVTDIEFDEHIDAQPKRVVKRTVTKEGEVSFEYAAPDSGVIFVGRTIQRWGHSWLLPWKGYRLADSDPKIIRTATFTLTPPNGQAGAHWKQSLGMSHDASITDADGSVKIDKTSWSMGGLFAADAFESRLPIHCTQLPLLLPGIEAYWIPFRSINNRDDAFILIFAKDEQAIQHIVKPLHLFSGRAPDTNFYVTGDLGSKEKKSD